MRFIPILLLIVSSAFGQTIAEKKAGLEYGSDLSEEMQKFLEEVNTEMAGWREELGYLYEQTVDLYVQGASVEAFQNLLIQINGVKENMELLQESWREMSVQAGAENLDEYALWHQPDTNISQLVSDYGSTEYIYLMNTDIAKLPVSVNSDLPIPRSSWKEILELVLNQNGIGIKQLNPYLRELYFIGEDNSAITLITNKREELQFLPNDARACFVLSPEPSDVRRIWFFLDKFANTQSTTLQMIGRDILIIGTSQEILSLLKIYEFVHTNQGERDYKLLTLRRVKADEMTKVLETIFNQFAEDESVSATQSAAGDKGGGKQRSSISAPRKNIANSQAGNGLRVITLGDVTQAIFLIGTREEIIKAERIVSEIEGRVGKARDKVIYTHKVRHSDPEELAQVLQQIYSLLLAERVGFSKSEQIAGEEGSKQKNSSNEQKTTQDVTLQPTFVQNPFQGVSSLPLALGNSYITPGSAYGSGLGAGGLTINPRPITSVPYKNEEVNQDRDNFIIDKKTGNIVMVLIGDLVPKMEELIQTLDVPKKMVQIEVLLFEKRLNRQTNYGLNLLRLGDAASGRKEGGALFNEVSTTSNDDGTTTTAGQGIFEFFFSRPKSCSFPAFDLIYRFLLKQDDIVINANPSVVTLNQTEALIAIKEEISLNVGTLQVPTVGGTIPQETFTRAQYGITIQVTPTIHMAEPDPFGEQEENYVTLKSDVTFDTVIPGSQPDRPDVVRRNIVNEARVCDGQSIILGGLRRKNTSDSTDSIPFLGEIPGIGKLFSTTELQDNSTEMFIVLTPKIIVDPCEDTNKIKCREMRRRPGDIPAFMCKLVEAQEAESNRLFQSYMTMLFGRPPDRCVPYPEEYDGR